MAPRMLPVVTSVPVVVFTFCQMLGLFLSQCVRRLVFTTTDYAMSSKGLHSAMYLFIWCFSGPIRYIGCNAILMNVRSGTCAIRDPSMTYPFGR